MEKEQLVENEKKEARENFGALLDLVFKRYESPNPFMAKDPEQIRVLKEHVIDVIDLCIERRVEKGLDDKQLKMLEVAAILHDLTKLDQPSSEVIDIPNYMLAAHGELSAGKAGRIMEQSPEVVETILGKNYSAEEKTQTINVVVDAIKRHMGPHPGFMTFILEKVNAQLREKGKSELKHPHPADGEVVSETLLAADMLFFG